MLNTTPEFLLAVALLGVMIMAFMHQHTHSDA